MEITTIEFLPIELITEILINTDGKTIGKCRRVCKQWKSIIDNTDLLWEKICLTEFQHPSLIAKEKRHIDCKWYHIHRNLIVWNNVTNYEVHLREFQDFPLYEFVTNMDNVTHGNFVGTDDILLFEIYSPKIANNNHALVFFFKLGLIIIRNVENTEYVSEKFYKADGFSLSGNKLYFYRNKEVFMCDLLSKDLQSKLFYKTDFNIKEIQHYNGQTFLFTQCWKIVILSSNNETVQPIKSHLEWIHQIKHICAIDHRNYIGYSKTILKIETDKYRHLYLEIPPITALFFYGNFALLGTKIGEILLYRQSSQKSKAFISPPDLEFIAQLPDGNFAIQLDVSERRSGPVIIVTTMTKIMFLEIDFFPEDKDDGMPISIERLNMYEKLTRIKDIEYLHNLKVH